MLLANSVSVARFSTLVTSRFLGSSGLLVRDPHRGCLRPLPSSGNAVSAAGLIAGTAGTVQRRGAFSAKKRDLEEITGLYPGLRYEVGNKRRGRPLSPFLFAYKMHFTMALSLLHRITGAAYTVLLYGGSIAAVASGKSIPELMNAVRDLPLDPNLLMGAKFVLAWGAVYHMVNGLRHLVFDLGKGFNPKTVIKTGYVVVAVTTLVTIFWFSYY